jgi:hypothetical protein
MKRKVEEGMGGIVFLSDDLVHHNLTGILSLHYALFPSRQQWW